MGRDWRDHREPREWLAYLAEALGQVAQAILDSSDPKDVPMEEELALLTALAVAALEDTVGPQAACGE